MYRNSLVTTLPKVGLSYLLKMQENWSILTIYVAYNRIRNKKKFNKNKINEENTLKY